MSPTLARRIVLTVLPAVLVALVGISAVFGRHGLLRQQELAAELDVATERLAAIERENASLILTISAMEKDPVVIERAIADELGFARKDATLYRFDLEDGPSQAAE